MQSDKLVPRFILEELAAGRKNGRFQAACLFIDTSGFTPLTSQLMAHGKAGAEELADVLATLFRPLLNIVEEQGGFISGFAGDGLKAVFPLDAKQPQTVAHLAAQAAWQMHLFMTQNNRVQTPFGSFSFAAKVSVSFGDVEWGVWEGEVSQNPNHQFRAYFIEGPALAACLQADALAVAGEVLFTKELVAHLPDGVFNGRYQNDVWFVEDVINDNGDPGKKPASITAPQPLLDSFYPSQRLPQTIGEFRQVVTTFINLRTLPEPAIFAPLFFRLLNQYGGYLCRIGRIGDKDVGGTLHIFWGAPEAYENDIDRALNFALDLRRLSSVEMRIGISANMAFAGYVGGDERAEYTCYSSYVNLAARQMVLANWDDILVDSELVDYTDDEFIFEEREPHTFKGFEQPRPIIALKGRLGREREPFFRGDLIGRQEEMAQLSKALAPLDEGTYAGVVVLVGEAGIGKSRLVHDFLEHSPLLDSSELFLLQTDEVLRQSLNPFRYMLRQLFDQSASQNEAENLASFMTIYQNLVQDTADPEQRETLELRRPFIASLLGLQVDQELMASIDVSRVFENTVIGLKALLLRLAQDNGIILQLEDAHWLDEDSKTFLRQLFRNVQHAPIGMIITSREPLPADLFDAESDEPQVIVQLRPLPHNQIQTFIEERLMATVTDELIDLLAERTDGNPFFMEQLLLYWQENTYLTPQEDGRLTIHKTAATIPLDVRAVLMARIDQLVQEVRDVVQTAAILGREFELLILSHILREDLRLDEKVAEAERAAIWSAITEMQYLFKHALMRDIAYEMQLEARLRHLHLLAAQAFEQIFASDLGGVAVDLAFHYDRASDKRNAIHWYKVAGERAATGYANSEAIAYFTRAMELLDDEALLERYDLLLKREHLHIFRGNREAQRADLDEIATLTTQLDDGSPASVERQTEHSLREAIYLDLISSAAESAALAETAVSLAQQTNDYVRLTRAYIAWGKALWPQSLLKEAEDKLERALTLSQTHGLRELEGQAYRFLGVVLDLQGLFKESRQKSRASLQIFTEINNLDGIGSAYNNIGITYLKQGNYPEAQNALSQAYAHHHESGNRAGMGWNSGNLGFVYSQMGEFEKGLTYYERANEVFIELGDRWSQAMAQGHLGNIAERQGHFSKALSYHSNALSAFSALGYRQGVGNAKAALGSFWRRVGRYELGISLLTEALAIFAEIEAQRNRDQGLMTRALVYHLAGENEKGVEDASKAVEGARQREDRHVLGYALTHLADAQAALGEWKTAVSHYQEAAKLRQQAGEHHLRIDTLAGLAHTYKQQGNLTDATVLAKEVADYLINESTDGLNRISFVYWACYHILEETGDEQAGQILEQAMTTLVAFAQTIEDDTFREMFWAVPVNGRLQAAYTTRFG